MNYFLLAETEFFRLINEAGDCNMETAYKGHITKRFFTMDGLNGESR